MNHENVKKLLDGYEKQVDDIRYSALQMAWYMRGSVSYTDVLNMSPSEIASCNEIIEENLETTKKTNIPFF